MCEEEFLNIIDKKAVELDIEWLKSFRRCTLSSTFGSYMDQFEKEKLRSFMRSILETVLKNCECDADFEIDAKEKNRRKLLMQCLVNAANRSENLRSCADEYSERCLRILLKMEWLQNETFAAVINFSKPENGEIYYHIACDCSILWNQVRHDIKRLRNEEMARNSSDESQNCDALISAYDKRSWLLAVFAKYLEIDDNFLTICDEIIEPALIDTVIDVVDTLRKKDCNIKLAVGNVKYLLTFLEKSVKKFGTFEKDSKMDPCIFNDISRVHILLKIILELISLEQYHSVFKADITAAKVILYIIEG